MIIPCTSCGGSLDWALGRVGNQPLLMSKCRHCNPRGPWLHEQVEIVRSAAKKLPAERAAVGAKET